MNTWIAIAIGVMVAGFIGGITNYFAIKMLFHPRHEWRIGRRRVPFTPGLIPKRREEIARSLGRVVSEYLVTSDAFSMLLRKEAFRQTVADRLKQMLVQAAESERTLGEWVLGYWPEDKREQGISAIARVLEDAGRRGIGYLWRERGMAKLTLGELAADWPQESRRSVVVKAADYIALTVKQELYTAEGERMLLKLTTQVIEQAGGFLGAMASIFLDEAKLAAKLRQSLVAALEGGAVRGALENIIQGQLDKSLQLTLEELAGYVLGEDEVDAALIERISERFRWEERVRQLSEKQAGALLARHLDWLSEKLPSAVALLLGMIEPHVGRIFATLRLEDMVEAQVRDFPIERIEAIILSISGREFRAITWLGVLLGALIGLVQAVLLRLL